MEKADKVDLILVAAGNSARFGKNSNKIFFDLAGYPVFLYALVKFSEFSWFDNVFIVLAPIDLEIFKARLQPFYDKFSNLNKLKIHFVVGGKERYHSVQNALKQAHNLSINKYIFIHDVARPLVSSELIKKIRQVNLRDTACAPFLKINDLIKTASTKHTYQNLVKQDYYAVQTPQAILKKWVLNFFLTEEYLNLQARDEISVINHYNLPFEAVSGEVTNLKLTYFDDLLVARRILKNLHINLS